MDTSKYGSHILTRVYRLKGSPFWRIRVASRRWWLESIYINRPDNMRNAIVRLRKELIESIIKMRRG